LRRAVGFARRKPCRARRGIKAARFPQEKVFKDELPFAGGERPFADPACNLRIDGLRARLSFDDLVKRKAAFAAEQRN
jgi:hypothetical protein